MSHLRLILAAILVPIVADVVPAQQPSQGRPTQKMTLSFRRLSWFGLAVDCGTCLTSTATTGTQLPVITQISPGGPADRASLQVGDTILTLDGKDVLASDLPKTLSSVPPGTTMKLTVGSRRGRSTVSMTSEKAQIQFFKGDSLPVRYRGEYAQVTVDVMTMDAPVVTRDSTGAMLIHVGQHVIRLQRTP